MTTEAKPELYQAELKARHNDDVEIDSKDIQAIVNAESQEVNEKALLRKTDWHLVPWLAFLYLLSFLDRTNIGNANIFGLSVDLRLTNDQYAACLAVFFAFYVAFEVPSNLVMKAWRPSMWLPIIMLAWGIVMTLMGIVRNYEGLLVTRIFLGITEAGLFPGVSFYLTQWYRRYEINFRIALFFSAATAAGAFGGLLARLINLMHGVAGLEGWRWIFILEGILTVVAALASFYMLSDYPDTAKFLTPPERRFLQDRLLLDRDGCSHEYKKQFIKDAFLDWKVWFYAIMYMAVLTNLYCFSLFSPTLVANLGYSAATAQLMTVPPYAVAAVVTIGVGYLSDRLQRRGVIFIGFACFGMVGYILLLATTNTIAQYIGIFFAASGVYPLIPLSISWVANNSGGSLKKSVATAIIISVGNMGGIISSYAYSQADRPRFIKGHSICLGFLVLAAAMATFLVFYLTRQNTKRDRAMELRGRPYSDEEKKEMDHLGDDSPWFRFTL